MCEIIQINFSIFCKISCIVFVPSLVPLLFKDLPLQFETYKERIRKSVRSDPETGISYQLSRRNKKLLEYNLHTRLIWLLRCQVGSLCAVCIYFISNQITRLYDSAWYDCFVAASTILGLLPVGLSIWLALSILFHFVQLSHEVSGSTHGTD